MERHYTLVLAIAAMSAQAQQHYPALPRHADERHAHRAAGRTVEPSGDRGSSYYTETFDTGLNGWTVDTELGIVDWKWTDVGPGPTSSTYPVPPLETTPGWAIIDDDFDGVNGQSTNSSLISPVIDLSSAPPNLKVEFHQYFQEFQLDTTFVGVSTDGGVTWDEIAINDGVGRDGRPNPELIDVNISDWVAGNPSNVQLRFRYVATWDYGWQVDNIVIRDLPNNDMALMRARNTAFDFANTGFDYMDYTMYPQSQLGELVPNATVKNKGFLQQTGVTLNVSVDGPGGNEQNETTSPDSYAPGTEQVLTSTAVIPGSGIGDYSITFTVDQNETDEVPENNQIVNAFTVSDNIYAHDDGAVQSFQIQGPDNADEPFAVGNHFVLLQDGTINAVQVALHANTPVGSSIYGAIYTPPTTTTDPPGLVDLTGDHVVTADDLNAIGGTNFVTIPFDNPVPLTATQPYLVVAGSSEGTADVHFATSGVSEAQVSIIYYPNITPPDDEFFITKTPMVRMVLGGGVGMAENGSNIAVMATMPNPFSETTSITFNLLRAENVSLTVTDVTGKQVLVRDLGALPAGEHRHHLDGRALAPGAYTYTLLAGDARISQRMVIAR